MDVTVKRERNVQTLHTFAPNPKVSFLPVPEKLDLEHCFVLSPEKNSEEELELRRLSEAIKLRDTQAMGSPTSVRSGRVSRGSSSGGGGRRYRNETDEGRRLRLARDAERRRQSRKMESDEDAVSRRAKQAAARRYYLQYLETEEDAKRRRKQNAEHKRLRRMMMTAEERDEIKRKESARRAEKRREAQEQKRSQGEERVQRGNESGEASNKERLGESQLGGQQHLSVPMMVPQMPPQPPIEMKPLLSQMGFPPGLAAPFQIDHSRGGGGGGGPYNGYAGY